MVRTREDLLGELGVTQARLAALGHESDQLCERLDELRRELERVGQPAGRHLPIASNGTAAIEAATAPSTSAEKVALFKTLFRGRTDVFPKYWENAKTGRKGYSPASANEWVRGVCEKPRVKCGECPSQAFIAFDDRRVLEHLQGHLVMGVYPMLADDTCWVLAADFDKGAWGEDVLAFAETCGRFGLPVALERSRSGNGAHAWFFFDEPISANVARRVGCFLLTETMARRSERCRDRLACGPVPSAQQCERTSGKKARGPGGRHPKGRGGRSPTCRVFHAGAWPPSRRRSPGQRRHCLPEAGRMGFPHPDAARLGLWSTAINRRRRRRFGRRQSAAARLLPFKEARNVGPCDAPCR
jgi:hypothetical protein